jgi:hypothetical protein
MDDFQYSSLNESRSEYSAILISKLSPCIIEGIYSIYKEAIRLCEENEEQEKYLMTFQNFLGRVPKWNQEIVNKETERITKSSGCSYLEDLLTCVHVSQLKILTSIRVGQRQKKIDIDIPQLEDFIHKVYIDVARRIYKNVYLFEKNILPLQRQKNLRETELLIKESILNTIRENMPIEAILRSYLDETNEEDVEQIKEDVEEVIEKVEEQQDEEQEDEEKNKQVLQQTQQNQNQTHEQTKQTKQTQNIVLKTDEIKTQQDKNNFDVTNNDNVNQKINFNHNDQVQQYIKNEASNNISTIPVETSVVPKTIENLEQISNQRYEQRRLEDEMETDSEDEEQTIKIMDNVKLQLDDLDVHTIDNNNIQLNNDSLLDDIEILA